MTHPRHTMHPSEIKKIRQLALYYLARRDHTVQELHHKLHRKGHTLEDITAIIHEMLAAGYLNDARFTEKYIHTYQRKGYGPFYVSKQLQVKGIPLALIAQHIQLTDNAWFIAAHKAWQKKGTHAPGQDIKARAKLARFLQSRGFTREQIEPLFNEEQPLDLA